VAKNAEIEQIMESIRNKPFEKKPSVPGHNIRKTKRISGYVA